MAFTGTHSANTNIIINTGTEGIYLFKEPNIDFTNKSLSVVIDNVKFKEDIFNHHFLNDELNNFFGVSKEETTTDLLNLSESKIVKRQLFPNPKYSGIKSLTRRINFVFDWKDDPDFSSSVGHKYNIENTREASSGQRGYTIPTLLTGIITGSSWPLDYYRHPSNYPLSKTGNPLIFGDLGWGSAVVGELMISSHDGISYNDILRRNCHAGYRGGGTDSVTNVNYRILPFSSYKLAKSKPFKNNEIIYNKYKNYSILPEVNFSSQITLENFENIKNIFYSQSFDLYLTGSSSSALNLKFSEQKSLGIDRKIIFSINSLISILPYKNFYPCQYTLKAASTMSESLAKIDRFNQYTSFIGLFELIACPVINDLMSGFYNPGIIYNSIKAGLPVQFLPNDLILFSVTPSIYGWPRIKDSNLITFEQVFNPEQFFRRKYNDTINLSYHNDIIKNFLEEVRFTFCKRNNLEYFSSKQENKFGVFSSGTNYSMELSVFVKNPNFISGVLQNVFIGGVNYLDNKRWERIRAPSLNFNKPIWMNRFHTVDPDGGYDLSSDNSCLSTLRISFTPPQTREYTLNEIFSNLTLQDRITNYHQTWTVGNTDLPMYSKLTSSFNIFEKEFDESSGLFSWKIKSKWEFPFLCASGTEIIFDSALGRWGEPGVDDPDNIGGGLWHDFCSVPTEDQGLFISISDVIFTSSYENTNLASLIQKVGFSGSKEMRVGELNEQKEIGELICILPIDAKTKSTFKISKDNSINKFNEKMMRKYILPGKLDHIHYPIDATLFFCEEITDIWSKKDLSYIWQNLLPENGMNHKEKNTKIVIDDREVLRTLSNKDIYFMIFKCKLRSKNNENDNIGSNWPWDYCSIAELIKIDMEVE